MSSPDDESLDPFEAHFHREPLPGASVRIVVIAVQPTDPPGEAATAIRGLLAARGRDSDVVLVDPREARLGEAVERGLKGTTHPLALITREGSSWNAEQIDALLGAIAHCDHVVGRRKRGRLGGIVRWLAGIPWRWVFAVPVLDVHSPYRLHRLDRLGRIPLQSRSDFLDVEWVAKATFLGDLIDEVDVADSSRQAPRIDGNDVALVFKHPIFVRGASSTSERDSTPPEESKGEQEGDDGPDGEDQHGRDHVENSGAFQDHRAEGVQELGQG